MEKKKGSGFWHYVTYQQCPRKYWFNYILRFRPDKKASPLSYGSAIHLAVSTFHETQSSIKAQDAFIKYLTDCESSYEKQEKYVEDLNRGPTMIVEYCKTWEKDFERYEVVCQEKEMSVDIGGFTFVFKPDRVSRDRQINIFIVFEVKTTGFSVGKAFENVFNSDQATAYIYAWNKTHPNEKCETCIPDILYNKKGVYRCERPGDVYRTKVDLNDFELGMFGLIQEVSQKTSALDEYPPIQLFPRRGDCDGDGFYKCQFRSICRTFIEPDNPPYGFHMEKEILPQEGGTS